MRIRIMVTPVYGSVKAKEDVPPIDTDSDSDSDSESVEGVMSGLVEQMKQLCEVSEKIDSTVLGLYARAKSESIVWMHEPLRPNPTVKAWCSKHHLPSTPTINELTDAIFAVAQSLDYETRMLTFRRVDADMLWQGQQRLSIYDVITRVPGLFI